MTLGTLSIQGVCGEKAYRRSRRFGKRAVRDPRLLAPGARTTDLFAAMVSGEDDARWFWKLLIIRLGQRMRARIAEISRYYADYTFSGSVSLNSLRRVRKILKARGIPCVVWIPPLHEAVVRRMKEGRGAEGFRRWKAEVEAIFPVVFDFADSRWSAASNFFRLDPVHFKPAVGAALINEEILPRLEQNSPRSR